MILEYTIRIPYDTTLYLIMLWYTLLLYTILHSVQFPFKKDPRILPGSFPVWALGEDVAELGVRKLVDATLPRARRGRAQYGSFHEFWGVHRGV